MRVHESLRSNEGDIPDKNSNSLRAYESARERSNEFTRVQTPRSLNKLS